MNKKVLAVLSMAGLMATLSVPVDAETRGEEYKLRFKGVYSVTNNSTRAINANGTTTFPNTVDNAYSDILDEKITVENDKYQYTEQSAEGNRKVSYSLEDIAPRTAKTLLYEAIVKTNTVDYELKPGAEKGYPTTVANFVNPSEKVESDDPLIMAKAKELKDSLPAEQQDDPYYVSKKVFEYVQLNMRYTFDNRSRNKGASYALKNLVGNCEDYSSLMTALLRANDIPARTVTGYRINPAKVSTTEMDLLSSSNYTKHMWMEAYIEGYGWVAFDPTVASSRTATVRVNDTTPYSVTAYLPLTTPYMGTFARLEQLYLKDSVQMASVTHTMQTTGSPSAFKVSFLAKRTPFDTFEEEAIDAADKAPKPVAIRIMSRPAFSLTPVPLTANYTLSDRKSVTATDVTWTSSNPDVATVEDGKAVFTGKAGSVTFTAKGGKGGVLSASYTTTVARSLQIPESILYKPEGQTLTAPLVYSNGVRTNVDVTWTSSNPDVAAIDENGKVTYSGKPGSFVITATAGDGTSVKKSGVVSATLNVTGSMSYSPNPVKLAAQLTYNSGVRANPTVTWTSSNPDVATISEDGTLTFTGKPGNTVIEATAGVFKFTRKIVVSATLQPVGNMRYSTTPSKLTTQLVYNSGVRSNPTATWTSSNPDVATISEDGTLTFTGKPGNTVIEAKAGDFVSKTNVGVSAQLAILGNLVYSPTPVKLATQLTYNSGIRSNPITTWKSSNPDVATISEDGTLTYTGKPGNTVIEATSGPFKTTRTVVVSANLQVLGNLAYSATPVKLGTQLVYNSGTRLNPPVTWKSSNSDVATISADGTLTYTGKTGSTIIEVSSGTFKTTRVITVAANLQISGNLGYSTNPGKLTSQLVYNSGVRANPPVTWKSSNPNVATISEDGTLTFTGLPGSTVIEVTSGQFKTARTVSTTGSLAIKENIVYSTSDTKLTTEFTYSNRTKVTPPADKVVWKSTNTNVATISADGTLKFTGKPGTVYIQAWFGNAVTSKRVIVR